MYINPEFHECCTCGYSWKHGQDGSHSCAVNMAKTIAKLREQLAAAINSAGFSELAVNELKEDAANLRMRAEAAEVALKASKESEECHAFNARAANKAYTELDARLRGAEAKLKAVSEQEPSGYISSEYRDRILSRQCIVNAAVHPSSPYAGFVGVFFKPVPPADVQATNTVLIMACEDYQVSIDEKNERIAELKRNLAEQQAFIASIKAADDEGVPDCILVDRVLIHEASDEKIELNTLLAKAREEGWKEAVQDCIVAIEESQPPETTPWDCVSAIRNKISKLAAAPKPEVKS